MIEPIKREMMTARLPGSACTEEMLVQVAAIAEAEDTSVSAVVRHAVSVFLSTYNPKGEIYIPKEIDEVSNND